MKVPTTYIDKSTNKVMNLASKDYFLSSVAEIETDGEYFIQDLLTGNLIKYPKKYYKQGNAIEATVIPQCKDGITVYNSSRSTKTKTGSIERGGSVYLTKTFNTDSDGNIWGKIYYLPVSDDGESISYNTGYILYRARRNNFANVKIVDAPYTTVLTNGAIDDEKFDSIVTYLATPKRKKSRSLLTTAGTDTYSSSTTTNADTGALDLDETEMTDAMYYRLQNSNTNDTSIPAYLQRIGQHAPEIVQNKYGFPLIDSTPTTTTGQYTYDYSIDLSDFTLTDLYNTYNINVRTLKENTAKNMTAYNRFKLANYDDILSRGYMHIFFTRPDLNYYDSYFGGNQTSQFKNDAFCQYVYKRNPEIIRQLIEYNNSNHEFMMLLSNKATNFPLNDDGINAGTLGKSRNGYQVAYGRRRDSELGSSLSITFKDTRNFDILYLHKLWIDYITNVFTGRWTPKMKHINNKELDYAVSAYVIVTAEDFETILFWSKYYGLFPISIPYSSIAWSGGGTTVQAPELSVAYRYSWKEDLNPAALAELNYNAFRGKPSGTVKYKPIFNENKGVVDTTWVGAPFVEVIDWSSRSDLPSADLTDGSGLTYKLRFRAL
jgi:hypothetical protein